MSGRLHKSILNAEANLLFSLISLFLAFFSRKIFLDNLGADFIGLTGTLGSILGYLNLAELGIGSCISFFLYKPIQTKNHTDINEIMSVFGYLYRCIGFFILVGAFIISLFFPLIFSNTILGLSIVYFTFYSFLGAQLIGYFINYRQIILSADQKNYIVIVYFRSAEIIKILLQIYLAYTIKNLYVWVFIEFAFGLVGCLILNWKINKEYPWLNTNKSKGKLLLKKYPEIKTKTKQIFVHRIKDFVLRQSDELFIFVFASLKMVAYYGNYVLIISKITSLLSTVLSGTNEGIGNLVAEGNKANMMKVFWELTTIHHLIAGIICFSIYYLIEPFISLWLGHEYILDHRILILLLIYMYINNSRGSVDMFNHAHGLYADVWSAWTELAINLIITIIAGDHWGIIGILLGKIISVLLIIVFWKPYYLFSSGLKMPYFHFWDGSIRYYIIFAIAFTSTTITIKHIHISPYESFISWVTFACIIVTLFTIIECAGLFLFAYGSKDLFERIKQRLL